jgi:hypothetical protein
MKKNKKESEEMIYTDGLKITSDSRSELMKFANKIGVSKSWYYPAPVPYFVVLTPSKMDYAISKGARIITRDMMNNYIKGLGFNVKKRK